MHTYNCGSPAALVCWLPSRGLESNYAVIEVRLWSCFPFHSPNYPYHLLRFLCLSLTEETTLFLDRCFGTLPDFLALYEASASYFVLFGS